MVRIQVNGEDVDLSDVDPDTPLLWVLRDHIGLTGTKYGCGKKECGACVVHIDGVSQRTCRLSIKRLNGKKVTTIEGLSKDGNHEVQEAWREHNVSQCGYCQSGQIMRAVTLLEETPRPTDADIDAEMDDQICRCGTYPRIRAAIHSAGKKIRERGSEQKREREQER